jgi:hypothetical protein
MRRSSLAALAAAVALAPAAGRGDEVFPAVPTATADGPAPTPGGAPPAEGPAKPAAPKVRAAGAAVGPERGAPALAASAPGAAAPGEAGPVHLPRLGLALGGGFPDLATASLVFRPVDSVRLFAGPAWSTISWGVQGGLVVAPWNGFFTPTLSAEAGELFRTDLSFLAKDQGGVPSGLRPLLARIDYRWMAADVGFELGSPRGFSFYLRLGLSFVVMKTSGTATYTSDGGARVTFKDPQLSATLPALKLGVQYWF